MKKSIFTLLTLCIFSLSNSAAQKVVTVTISAKTSISEALEKCKEAGKEAKFGSRDYEANEQNGKITLWRNVSHEDVFCEIKAVQKDGITTMYFRLPHTPGIVSASWTNELRRITKHIHLPEMMVGEYFDGIE